MSRLGITWKDLSYFDWTLEARGDGLVALSKTQNGERTATLFCRKGQGLRLSVESPNPFGTDVSAEWITKRLRNAALFGAEVPLQNVSASLSRSRLIIEVILPSSIKTSSNNWLPDGKTAAWYVREFQGLNSDGGALKYDPTSSEWMSLSQDDKQFRRELFERTYKEYFGSLPTYGADGNPVVPSDLQIPRDLGGLSMWAGPGFGEIYDNHIPGKNFLIYSKLASRNCIQ